MAGKVEMQWYGDEQVARMRAAIDTALTDAAMRGSEVVRQGFQRLGGSSAPAGTPPAIQTGHLKRSVTWASPQDLGTPGKAAIGTNVKYGRYQEKGAYITPKKARALAVPISREAKRASAKGLGPRSMPNLFMLSRKGRDPLLAVKRARGALKIMYVLKKSVRLKPRPWLKPGFEKAKPLIRSAFASSLRQSMNFGGA